MSIPSRPVPGARREGLLGLGWHEPRVVDDEAHIPETFSDHADVAALAVFIGILPEGHALMNADDFHVERACLLDHSGTDVVQQKKPFSVGPPLRIGFPGDDFPALRQFVHDFHVTWLIWVHSSM